MATQITATLPTLDFPKEVDYPTQEDWAAFSAAAELNFGILGGSWSTQMQLWKNQANAMSMEVNNSADIAQGLANYQGNWTSKGYTLGQSVSVSGVYYICKLTHATGQNPTTVGSIYWNLALGNWSFKADKTEVALKIDKDISPYSSKPTPIDSDLIPLSDSASSFGIKKLTWANIKATLQTYFDTLYLALSKAPAGNIIAFASVTAPYGHLKANGALVSRTVYSALFAAIGTTFGAGDGSTTFALPDLRGYFPRGWDDGRGIDVNRVFGSTQQDDFKSHTHANGFGASAAKTGTTEFTNYNKYVDSNLPLTAVGGVETRPKNIALLYCIKY